MEDRESLSPQMRSRGFMLFYICEHQMPLHEPGERELMKKHALHVSIIGGLAAASALQRQGIQVTLFERNPELREIGAGLTLSPGWLRWA
jgi:NADPH-dependent glutamate synthase beta subunit-like oxidoreductase